jgi:DNA polymerase I-like protein with 3'-5' exonuclease and polymerase domains
MKEKRSSKGQRYDEEFQHDAVIHDEIIIEASTERAEEIEVQASKIMCEAFELIFDKVPCEVESKVAQSWGEK